MAGAHRPVIKTLGMPNSDTLAENLKGCLRKDFDEPRGRGRPLYAVSGVQRTASRHAHDLITAHVQGVIALAIEWVPREPSYHSATQLFQAAGDTFSDSDDASEEEDNGAQNSLLEYYANMVGEDGEKPDIVAAVSKQETAAANLRNKAANQNRYKRSTSISSQGSGSLANSGIAGSAAAASAVLTSNEPVRLSVEMLLDVDSDGFFKRFRDTQVMCTLLVCVYVLTGL